jgi:hypothetical protein
LVLVQRVGVPTADFAIIVAASQKQIMLPLKKIAPSEPARWATFERNTMAVTIQDGVPGKRCATCHHWKPLTDFPSDPTKGESQGARHCRCRECHSQEGKTRRADRRAVIARAKQEGLL